MTPEQLIMKYREEFFNTFEYDPPVAVLMEEIKDNTLRLATHAISLTKQIENIEKELNEYLDVFNTHKKALEILRSEHK